MRPTRGGVLSATDDVVANNASYAAAFTGSGRPLRPAKKLAVLACMDSRLDLFGALGLAVGDAHIIRNAGGVATDDAIRSLLISQRLLGTEEIVLVHHTDCGMVRFTDDEMKAELLAETGVTPAFALESFRDLDANVKQTAARIAASPFVAHKAIRGFIYEVDTGRLREVPLG